MPLSTFVDKREIQRRRTATTPYEDELILLPVFDTFIFFTPDFDSSGGDSRWTSVLQEEQAPKDSSHLVVGLMNPWNDNDDYVPPVPPSPATPRPVRTPTRSILAYGMTGLPANSSLIFAKLNLTTKASQNWLGQSDAFVENTQGSPPTPDQNIINEYPDLFGGGGLYEQTGSAYESEPRFSSTPQNDSLKSIYDPTKPDSTQTQVESLYAFDPKKSNQLNLSQDTEITSETIIG